MRILILVVVLLIGGFAEAADVTVLSDECELV
jgi:hypothetical protein